MHVIGKKTNEDKQKSLKAYLASLPDEMTELSSSDTVNWLLGELSQGRCLVLFDALDEVNDPDERSEVQKAIQNFVIEADSQTKGSHAYTRFLITSRIAGYEKYAFPYPHYRLAELTKEQIQEFLPRWCRASARRNLQNISTEEQRISREATLIERDLLDALETYQGFALMAENPFLLTLLVIMRQNKLELPHRRIELYEKITQIFLGSRNTARHIPEIPEKQALQLLGPVAYQLQASKNDFMTKDEVIASIIAILKDVEHIPAEQAPQEAKVFLERVRERGGIFVFRTGDFLGFFHRTFREYFAARHLLDRLTNDSTNDHKEQKKLLAKAQDTSDLWREPFLLTIAYNGKSPDAQRLMKLLLARRKGDSRKQHAHDVLLVGQCLIEAEPFAIPFELQQQIIQTLLEVYQDALVTKDIQVCQNGEEEFISLLCGVSNEHQYSALLQTLQQTLKDISHQANLHTLLTLLLIIAPRLRRCADVVFTKLVPPLLGLAGLPAIGQFEPTLPNSTPDFTTIDGALNVLRSLCASGPAGVALKEAQASFEPYLEQLARYSLEKGLITPTLIPREQASYKRYEQAIERWLKLQQHKSKRAPHVEEAISIQHDLLHLVEVAKTTKIMSDKTMVIVRDIICALPARTEPEITYILKIAQNEQDEQIHRACATAFQRSRPQDEGAWIALKARANVGH